MTNDERREKRVQASLKVRYKSATVTEFIEKHSHDISPGGVFIRSQKPLPKGSLLKIDFRLEDDTAVIQGVGRVVWIREAEDDVTKPPGMGIKFIRLDENSKLNIHKIISVQKSGAQITRASILGDEDVPEDENEEVVLPEGKQVRDSVAPSVDVNMDVSPESKETEDDNEPTKKIDVGSKQTKSKDEKSDSSASAVSAADAPETKRVEEKSATPAAEEKKGNGILVVLLLIAVLALGYFLLRPKSNEVEKSDVDETSAGDEQEAVVDTGVEESAVKEPAVEEPQPEPEPAAAMSGQVVVASDVEGATVLIDGAAQSGVTPLTIPALEVGEHEVALNLFGYEPLTEKITLAEGEPFELKVELKSARQVMSLKANVDGAKVFVGEKQIGRTPIKSVKRRDPGFTYVIVKPGYQDYEATVTASDWVYADGVYALEINAEMVEEPPAPKATASVAAEETAKPVSKPRVRSVSKPKAEANTATDAADGDGKASSESAADTKPAAAEPKTVSPAETKSSDAPKDTPAEKPAIKAAGADENPY